MLRGILNQVPWSTARLFTQGQQGAWYDPADLATLFEDSVGSDPVTADGDPVGLMLDKHLGLELGPELVVNGTFSDGGNGWDDQFDVWFFQNQRAEKPAVNGELSQPNVPINSSYHVVSWQQGMASGALFFRRDGFNQFGNFGSGDYGFILEFESGSSIRFEQSGTAPEGVWLDNVSVRELPGNHATQDTTAAKPTYRTDGTLHWLEFDGDGDQLVATIPGITNATVAIAKSTGTEITYPVDLSSGTFTMSETNYGIIVREGEFTEQEALDVTTYLNAKAGIS